MANLKPSMRLKVKGDTFFLPDPNGSVYFRNNLVSFRMEGRSVNQWIEKLIPMFNGEHSLDDLTNGLSPPYRDRVYEIARSLYDNGFVRDVSEDIPHQLTEAVLRKYASQIEYLDSVAGSGANRFQSYRRSKVLAVGSGPFFVSLVSALLESGLPKLHVMVTDSMPTNRQRMAEIVAHARKSDLEVAVDETDPPPEMTKQGWMEAVQPFDSILYVSQEGNLKELHKIQIACKEAGKVLLPAICWQQAGVAGPLVQSDDDGGWESMRRRIHQTAIRKNPQQHAFSTTAGAMLSNILAFQWLKIASGVTRPELSHSFFLLDLETLEGQWHSSFPHPLVTRQKKVGIIPDAAARLQQHSNADKMNGGLLAYFSRLTSPVSGILHVWDEEELIQLPLSQCKVQAADPLSEGPAELLPDIVCTGLTHQEARREAGLTGIESYASRLAVSLIEAIQPQKQAYIGVGAGETFAEGVCRGLQKCLNEELLSREGARKPNVIGVKDIEVDDERCRFYMQAITTLRGEPSIGIGEEVSGLPVVWIGTAGCWYGSVGLNTTLALRNSLQQALLKVQNNEAFPSVQGLEVSSVQLLEETTLRLRISREDDKDQSTTLQQALQVLKRNGRSPLIYDLTLEPFMREGLDGVYGVLLREEEV
jgi:putative thiazole-containing bacteriocin maturation protein